MARARKGKTTLEDLEGLADPKAPLDGATFLKAAHPVLRELDKDLLARAKASPAVTAALKARHAHDKKNKRTAASFAEWQHQLTQQVGAAWLLSCVFVRTLEDRGLLEQARIAGPGASDSERMFFEMAPSLTERDYLRMVFRELSHLPAGADLFDARHNPVWLLGPSAEATRTLLRLFRTPSADQTAFRFGQDDTRFLGDLYQDLDEDVRKRFALLQTPRFVEHFILDRTLEPAIERFGLDEATVIDPTCGSGHFLLGAFDRLLDHRRRQEPDLDLRQAAQKALEQVHGADINPYAVAIARFRLTLAFLDVGGFDRLKDAPKLPLDNLVVADSLLHNPQLDQLSFAEREGQSAEDWLGREYALDDEEGARRVLGQPYAAVVGNPPYITCKDKVLRDRYREAYQSAFREYSLAVPFTERFFHLARQGGSVGMITANSFMKREFGNKLIEEYLPTVNLHTIVNTSGAYIPGHGTPTVLLFGTHEDPVGDQVQVVLASRGEPTTPKDPAQGKVWGSIAEHADDEFFENEYITVQQLERKLLAEHPWTLAGGGAMELKALLEERAGKRLGDLVNSIGFMCITKQDDVFSQPVGVLHRVGVEIGWTRTFVIGEHIRDWSINSDDEVVFPYDNHVQVGELEPGVHRFLWPWRRVLESRAVFGGKDFKEAGRAWYEYGQIPKDRVQGPCITFAEVATHNHFVLDRRGKVFNRTAPIIKLPETATEEDHLALLAYLNSSTACFLMKQVSFPKGGSGIGRGIQDEEWESRFQFDGTKLAQLPLPPRLHELVDLGRRIDELAGDRMVHNIASLVQQWIASPPASDPPDLDAWFQADAGLFAEMVGLQEELDWKVYQLMGHPVPPEASSVQDDPEPTMPGHRAFEMQMAREGITTAWFERNRYPRPNGDCSERVRHRLAVITDHRDIAALEVPDHKRRWSLVEPADALKQAARASLGDGIEYVLGLSVEVAALYKIKALLPTRLGTGRLEWLLDASSTSLAEYLATEAVPFLAAYRFSESGLEKHQEWQDTWDLQRREDAGEDVGDIPVPPKYAQKDYRDPIYWRLRGKLDVPKERFISYPGCESDHDGDPVYGWAGWNHLQRAQALATLYQNRKDEEGWPTDRLTPMLAGLQELIPWLKQWHNEISPEYGYALGDYFESYLDGELKALGLTSDDLRAWRPEARSRGRRGRAT